MTAGKRIAPRDDLRALEGYHSPQLDVTVRLNTNESPFAPPSGFVDAWLGELGDRPPAPVPGSHCTGLAERDRGVVRPAPGSGVLRERFERGAADPAAHLRRARSARARLRADVRAAQPHLPHHRDRGRRWTAPGRLRRRSRHRSPADRGSPTRSRVSLQPEQPDRHGRTARDRPGDPRRRRRGW